MMPFYRREGLLSDGMQIAARRSGYDWSFVLSVNEPSVGQRFDANVDSVQRELRHSDNSDVRRRRTVVGLSLVGMAAMTPVAMLQTGIIRHLPDPPIDRFNSDKANLSESAFRFGVPDGTVALASLAANIPLAAYGGRDRARSRAWAPLFAAAKEMADTAGAGWYFFQMATKRQPWCAYCITAAIANFGVLVLTVPEAMKTLRQVRD